MADYGYTFNSGDGVTPTRLNAARTISNIVNADIKSDAAIAHSKLANIPSGQLLLGNGSNVPTATTVTGDVTISSAGVTSIASGAVTSAKIADGTIVNADINASAAIVDTKLATISTAGKVSNSATTATNANTANAIVSRDASGNFSAGTITATLLGNVTGTASAIADGTVSTAKIVDGAVTNAKIASGVDASKLTTGTLPADRIGSSAITTARINDGAVTAAKLDGAQSGSAPIYGCRAWVNFNGARNATDTGASTNGGNVLVRASGNVSSVTKVATGQYTINFTTAMPDANYSTLATVASNSNSAFSANTVDGRTFTTTSAVRIVTAFANASNNGYFDPDDVSVSIIR